MLSSVRIRMILTPGVLHPNAVKEGVCSTVEGLVVVERQRCFALELGSLRGAIVNHPLDGACRRDGEWDCVRICDPLVVAVVVSHLVVNCS